MAVETLIFQALPCSPKQSRVYTKASKAEGHLHWYVKNFKGVSISETYDNYKLYKKNFSRYYTR